MSIFISKSRRAGAMTGELARRARTAFAGGQPFAAAASHRSGARSSLIRLGVPRSERAAVRTEKLYERATTLAHWMSARNSAAAAPGFADSAFQASVWPLA